MMELEGSPLYKTKQSQQVQLPTESSAQQKVSRISQQKMHNLQSEQCKMACFFDNQEKTAIAWLESSDHPSHSSDIATLDVHLFWFLQNSLNGKSFKSLENCKMHL